MSREVTCKFRMHGSDHAIVVTNPGEGRNLYAIWAADCYDPPIYVIEADDYEDLMEKFLDTPVGKTLLIDTAVDGDDYGWEYSPEDIARERRELADLPLGTRVWRTLKGTWVTDPKVGEYLREPPCADGGMYYDDDNVQMCELHNCRYFDMFSAKDGVPWKDYPEHAEKLEARFERAKRFGAFLNERNKERSDGQDEHASPVGCQGSH